MTTQHAPDVHLLSGFDADAPLDELEPLRAAIGDARVVAIGEGAHFVREFTHARIRLLRFLLERCGFGAVAVEFGFSDGFAIDDWVRGADTRELAEVNDGMGLNLTGELARWLRAHNATRDQPVPFLGLDLPNSARLRNDLDPLADFLAEIDPEALPIVRSAQRTADELAGESMSVAAPKWARLAEAEQDALTANLTRLVLRLRALEPQHVRRADQRRVDIALRRAESAAHTDHMFRAMHGIYTGTGLTGDPTVRERFLADSVRWQLDRLAPDTKLVVVAHNNHIQKTPVRYEGVLTALPMGHLVHHELGEDYRTIGLTHTADHIPEMRLDEHARLGFAVVDQAVEDPPPGSVEHGLIAAGFRERASLTLRPEGTSMRSQGAQLPLPVSESFDAMIATPTVTIDHDA